MNWYGHRDDIITVKLPARQALEVTKSYDSSHKEQSQCFGVTWRIAMLFLDPLTNKSHLVGEASASGQFVFNILAFFF